MNRDTELFEQFVTEILKIHSKQELTDFLYGILTPKEIAEIPTRLEIVKLLKTGVAQHQIAEKLQVGVATVTRGSKEIQKGRFENVESS